MAKREGTPKIPAAVREDYWGQGVDLKRFFLCVQGRLWTVLAAALAGALAFGASQQVPEQIGSRMLASTIEKAQPQEREYTREEIHQAAMSGTMSELMAYESSEYVGPEQIDFL